MPHRYELQNRQWERIQHLFPELNHHGQPGHPWKPHRQLLNGILWRLHSGAPWRDVPSRYGPWQTVYDRFSRWRLDGTWMRILTYLLDHLERHGRLGRDLWCVDATIIRATRAAGGAEKDPDLVPWLLGPKTRQFMEPPEHALGYSRGGFGTKVHLLIENHGIPVGVYLTGGQRHECKAFVPLMGHVLLSHHRDRPFWPRKMAGDKGYSYPEVRAWLKRYKIRAVIPTRKDQPQDPNFDKATYRRRNLIERVIGWFKECRALGTRYEKLAVSYLALWIVAMIDKLLKRRLSDSA
jgi:transposase